MELTNIYIFNYTEQLHKQIITAELRFPAKVNYIIQKNYKKLLEIYQELIH